MYITRSRKKINVLEREQMEIEKARLKAEEKPEEKVVAVESEAKSEPMEVAEQLIVNEIEAKEGSETVTPTDKK